MQELKMFGFPVVFDESDNRLVPNEKDVSFLDYSRKLSNGMFGLLSDSSYDVADEVYYDFYKAIGRDGERADFEKLNLRYDSTVIMAGSAGDEFKKTAGHFHCEIPGQGMSYPEYYQVIKGKALFVMQKVTDCNTDGKMSVEDAILVEVNAGEAVVIPPEYGHCTVNIGAETLVFVNLVACESNNYYDSVKRSIGMCCYVKKEADGGYRVEKNPGYDFACEPKVVTTVDNEKLGIHKDVPVYSLYLKNPEQFTYLTDPKDHMDDFFAVLKDK